MNGQDFKTVHKPANVWLYTQKLEKNLFINKKKDDFISCWLAAEKVEIVTYKLTNLRKTKRGLKFGKEVWSRLHELANRENSPLNPVKPVKHR